MISVSRFPWHQWASLGGGRSCNLNNGLWHAGCIAFLQGCVFVGPAWKEPPLNQGPSISIPTNFDGDPVPLPVISNPSLVTVLANDPDDEFLTFRWTVPRATQEPFVESKRTDAGDWVSNLHLPEEFVQSGDIITCVVTDQAEPRRNVVEIVWLAEVL